MSQHSNSNISTTIHPHRAWDKHMEDSTAEVFEMMVGGPIELMTDAGATATGDITGMIGLAGALCGVLSIRCTQGAAEKIAYRMLGGTDNSASSLRDALGEICNMVAGNLKNKIPGLADSCMLSVPTVVCGEDYELYTMVDGERFQIAMNFEGLPIWIALSLHN
jgi:chemotaxis protein CheX